MNLFHCKIPMYCFIIFSSIGVIGCLSADKNNTRLVLTKDSIEKTITTQVTYTYDNMLFTLKVVDNRSTSLLQRIGNRLLVDTDQAAYSSLCNKYYIGYLSIENYNNIKKYIDLQDVNLVVNSKIVHPILADSLPTSILAPNIKGSVKNIYNTGVIIASSVIVSAAIIAGNIDKNYTVLKKIDGKYSIKNMEKKDIDALYSKILHKYTYIYKNTIKKENSISARGKVEGIVFFEKKNNLYATTINLFFHRNQIMKLDHITP
jgi:hypothetical protein